MIPAIIIASTALAAALLALWLSRSALEQLRDLLVSTRRTEDASKALLAALPPPPEAISRAERIQRARGFIDACRGAELALHEHAGELQAALALAHYRAAAAHAKAELRVLGVE